MTVRARKGEFADAHKKSTNQASLDGLICAFFLPCKPILQPAIEFIAKGSLYEIVINNLKKCKMNLVMLIIIFYSESP